MSSRYYCVVLVALCAVAPLRGGPCEVLRPHWPDRYDNISVQIRGRGYSVAVYGEAGVQRAAAALLVAILRHVVGYSADLVEETIDICNLTPDQTNYSRSTILTPAAAYTSCETEYILNAYTNFTNSKIPSTLHLFAHVYSNECIKLAVHSSFYFNDTILESCDFIKNNDVNRKNGNSDHFVILARSKTRRDNRTIIELQKRIEELNLRLTVEHFHDDILLRKEIMSLQNKNKTFLFLHEDIWTHNKKVFFVKNFLCLESRNCSFDTTGFIRVGNGIDMYTYARPIWTLVTKFAPSKEDLRLILDHETSTNISSIIDASCSWVLNKLQIVEHWTMDARSAAVYTILICLCKDDPDFNEHRNVLRGIKNLLNQDLKNLTYGLEIANISCNDNENLLSKYISSTGRRTAGVVIWSSAITMSAVSEAKNRNISILLAGHNPVNIPSNSDNTVQMLTASLDNVSLAYTELFNRCGWSRVAILSDESVYSADFRRSLFNTNNILSLERLVNLTNIDNVLDEFRDKDARIFFINTKWDIASKILCTALKKGMTPAANLVWIVRDSRVMNCSEEGSEQHMYYFTIGVSWRGGQTAGGSVELQNELRTLWNTSGDVLAGSAGSSSLADALLFLGYGFASYLREYPENIFNVHDVGTAEKFTKVLKKLTISGTSEQLKIKYDKAIVFLERWNWTKGKLVALWYVTPSRVVDVWSSTRISTCAGLIGKQITDRKYCLFSSGDEFAPRCHTVVVIFTLIISFLAIIALYVARRVRRTKLKLRIEEERRRISSSLDGYLIKRNSIKLLHRIGSGSNGFVSFAELTKPCETIPVAAKEPRKNIAILEVNEFLREACILSSLKHDNVIRLIGICIGDGTPIILMEHAFYNDLKQYLTLRRQFAVTARLDDASAEEVSEVSESELTRFAKEAAQALEYLAEKRLIHRDVRAANCLIDKKRSLKLADFALARELDCESSLYTATRRRLLPVMWMPPESLNKAIFSTASDVWSLGVLILEIATFGSRPYGDWPIERIVHYIRTGGHPPLPPDISMHTRYLVTACWHCDENLRPTAGFICKYLKRNPYTISPALLTPDLPEPLINSTQFKRKTYIDVTLRGASIA